MWAWVSMNTGMLLTSHEKRLMWALRLTFLLHTKMWTRACSIPFTSSWRPGVGSCSWLNSGNACLEEVARQIQSYVDAYSDVSCVSRKDANDHSRIHRSCAARRRVSASSAGTGRISWGSARMGKAEVHIQQHLPNSRTHLDKRKMAWSSHKETQQGRPARSGGGAVLALTSQGATVVGKTNDTDHQTPPTDVFRTPQPLLLPPSDLSTREKGVLRKVNAIITGVSWRLILTLMATLNSCADFVSCSQGFASCHSFFTEGSPGSAASRQS